MAKLVDEPVQPLADGVTVIVAVTGVEPLLVAVNDPMFPEPLADRPMLVWLLVQLYVVPLTAPLNDTADVAEPLQRVWSDTDATVGVGLTVMAKLVDEPEQPLADGVTVIVAVTGAELLLVAVNDPMLPEPLPDRPMLVWSLVQL